MAMGLKNEGLRGRNFALTIILGVFIAIMVIVLFNLIVSYVYEGPKYEDYCKNGYSQQYPVKYGDFINQNCTFLKPLQEQADKCTADRGIPVYEYDDMGCNISLKQCDMCSKIFEEMSKSYNRNTFFVFALIGFVLIVSGLFMHTLLLQLVLLPAGAVLVIEAAMKNFNDKLAVIIILALLVVAAIYLAIKKLK